MVEQICNPDLGLSHLSRPPSRVLTILYQRDAVLLYLNLELE
jgi:hypothetical protein